MTEKSQVEELIPAEIEREEKKDGKFLKLKRYFTDGKNNPFDEVEWETTRVKIVSQEDGKVLFDHNVEHPTSWDEMAVRNLFR